MRGIILRLFLILSLLHGLALMPPSVPEAEAADVWVAQTSGTTYSLSSVAAVGATTAWAVGNAGILKTTDGGTTWLKQITGGLGTESFLGVAKVDNMTAWAVKSGFSIDFGEIHKTNDGGSTWKVTSIDGSSFISSHLHNVAVADTTTGWAVGQYGRIYKTINGGEYWASQPSGIGCCGINLYAVTVVTPSIAWVVGTSGLIRKTTDGGVTWSSQTSSTTNSLYGVVSLNSSTAWAVGESGTILKTTDGGTTWTVQTSGTKLRLSSIAAVSPTTLWVVGEGGTILKTTDGGATWVSQVSGTGKNLNGIAVTGSIGWAVGDGGTILRTNTANVFLRYSIGIPDSTGLCAALDSPTSDSISYGTVFLSSSAVSPLITARNCGTAAENFLVQGANAVATVPTDSNWALGPSPGADIYVHGFGDASAGPFTAMTTAATNLASSIAAGTTKSFYTQVKTPTSTTGTGLRNTTVTITATVP